METKHTKGEWKLTKDAKGVECNGKLIVTCWSARETSNVRLDGESWLDMRKRTGRERFINNELEPTANAKLIAAAPDLLKTCLWIKNAIEGGQVKRLFEDEIQQLNNSINKATK